MPRKAIDYSKCKFYRLVCKDTTVKECYVGHTTNETNRRRSHKKSCTSPKNRAYNLKVYKFIRDHGSWDNWQLIVHETTAIENKGAAVLRERFWLEHYGATLNNNVPGRTHAEYCVEHRDERVKRANAWSLAHKAELEIKHDCDCGGHYVTNGKLRHFRSQKHCTYIATL